MRQQQYASSQLCRIPSVCARQGLPAVAITPKASNQVAEYDGEASTNEKRWNALREYAERWAQRAWGVRAARKAYNAPFDVAQNEGSASGRGRHGIVRGRGKGELLSPHGQGRQRWQGSARMMWPCMAARA